MVCSQANRKMQALGLRSRESREPLHSFSIQYVLYKSRSTFCPRQAEPSAPLGINPLLAPFYRLNLIGPHFRRQPPLLDRELDSLRPSFLDIDKEPNDDTGSYAVDKPGYQLLIIMIKIEGLLTGR
jgi:hypothetical protein